MGIQVQRPTEQLPERGLGELLNETLVIYGRHLWRLIALVAAVQVPLNLISLSFGNSIAADIGAGLLGVIGIVVVNGMVTCAVGQHYVSGSVNVRHCLEMVWGRIVSLLIVAGMLVLAMAPVLVLALAGEDNAGAAVVGVVLLPVAFSLLVYWWVAAQAVVIERQKALPGVRRSFRLVRGSWWRVSGIIIIYWLVGLGMGIVIIVPFLIAIGIFSPDSSTGLANVLGIVMALVVMSVVYPLIAIGGALVYFDLRVRKEDFDLAILSKDMGPSLRSAQI